MNNKKRNDMSAIAKLRNHKVVKSNELIQKRTHLLTMQEQKIILFLISQLKPEKETLELMKFDIVDFCEVCGIESNSGKNYSDLKKTILDLTNKGFWLIGDEKETTVRWIDRAEISRKSGQIEIKLDNELTPHLLQLKQRYTQYDLVYTLGMKSKYSIRLYELLKSYQRKNETIHFELERLKILLGTDYSRWVDIKRRVIEGPLIEINKLSDIFVTYKAIKKGRSVAFVDFEIVEKTSISEKIETRRAISKLLDSSGVQKNDND